MPAMVYSGKPSCSVPSNTGFGLASFITPSINISNVTRMLMTQPVQSAPLDGRGRSFAGGPLCELMSLFIFVLVSWLLHQLRRRRDFNSRMRRGGDQHHPKHTELVLKHSKTFREKRFGQRHLNFSAGGQGVKSFVHLRGCRH